MIVLTVLSYSGAAADDLSASFDELGGSIGRADNNQLVLPDPERSISRLHAKVVFRGGHYAIVDNGSNPIAVNGTQLPAGREQTIEPGDKVQIGSYLLAVSLPASAAARSNDPFADLFGDGAHGLAAPATPAAANPWAAPAAAWPAAPSPAPAPLAAVAFSSAATFPAPPAFAASAARPAISSAAAGIADDWDFLAPAPPPAGSGSGGFGAAAPAAVPGAPLGLSMGSGTVDSLDQLFGLGGTAAVGDPLGAAPALALLMQPNMAAHADPLQSLGQAAAIGPASRPDHVSELNTPMPMQRVTPLPGASPGLPRGAIFSWDDPPRDGRLVTLPGAPRDDTAADIGQPRPPPATHRETPWPASAPLAAPSPAARAAPAAPPNRDAADSATAAPTAVRSSTASDDALLDALLQGLGVPGLRIPSLNPELMLLIGQMLRESTRGAVELLVARAALKREMRAQMTMITARENNPLKFSPSVEVALQHLLSPTVTGFMPAAPAVRDAFNDLRAHQLGVMAGMKAALDGVLQRFDPQQLEAKLTTRSAIDSLLPATRKARLWESFQQLFSQLSSEAQDDFDELFGKAFLRAYEDQLDRLHDEPGAR
jgi:type VI secretion system FHA domain protein